MGETWHKVNSLPIIQLYTMCDTTLDSLLFRSPCKEPEFLKFRSELLFEDAVLGYRVGDRIEDRRLPFSVLRGYLTVTTQITHFYWTTTLFSRQQDYCIPSRNRSRMILFDLLVISRSCTDFTFYSLSIGAELRLYYPVVIRFMCTNIFVKSDTFFYVHCNFWWLLRLRKRTHFVM